VPSANTLVRWVNENAFAPVVRARPCPTFGRPVHLSGCAPADYGPALLLMPFGFHLTMDTLPSGITANSGCRSALAVSGFRLRARLGFSIPPALSGRRGVTPAFGYDTPHSSIRGTLTLLNNALLSAHYGRLRPLLRHRYSSSWCQPFVISLVIRNKVLTFHTEACIELMPPLHRLPPGP